MYLYNESNPKVKPKNTEEKKKKNVALRLCDVSLLSQYQVLHLSFKRFQVYLICNIQTDVNNLLQFFF